MATMIHSMKGLGDNIYQRAFVKKYSKVWIDTPWPELYQDIQGVNFIQPKTILRTQFKNIDRQDKRIYSRFPGGTMKSIKYGLDNIIEGMAKAFGFPPDEFDLPDFGESPVSGEYALIRPVTLRSEWMAESRNPLPQYIVEASLELRSAGIKIVSVADLEKGQEWIVGGKPYADIEFHKGELDVKQLMALTKNASLVVGGIGWIVPACVAYKQHAWIICGGNGGFNHPSHITHECMDLSRINFVMPDNFCMCSRKDHNCDKTITGHRNKFRAYLASRGWDRISPQGGN